MTTLTKYLNDLAGTDGLDEQGAANALAGTSGLATQGALNAAAGTSGLALQGVLNYLAGSEGLGVQAAAARIIPRSGLQVWFDARHVNGLFAADPSADAAIGTWADLSGNSRNATQATGAAQPLFKPTGLSSGGAMVNFDGSDDTMATAWNIQLSNASVYVVAQKSALRTTQHFLGASGGGTGRFAFGSDNATGANLRAFIGGASSYDTAATGPTLAANGTAGVYSLTYTDDTLSIRANGGAATVPAAGAATTLGDGTALNIGDYNNTIAGFRMQGGISAILIYNAVHSSQKRTAIERSLGSIFGITVA